MFNPRALFASEVFFVVSPNTIPGDHAVVIDMYIESEGEVLNALDGVIGFEVEGHSAISDVIVETGGSPFTLWPTAPSFNTEEQVVRLTGGTTESVSGEARMLRMRLFTDAEKSITVSWLRGEAYRNDGLGTAVPLSSRSLTINPERGEPNIISPTSEDTEPPRIESIEVGQDEDTYDGKRFLTVYAVDAISGVSHIEVIEGGVKTRVDSGPYFFMNQSDTEQVLLIVYDKAGNSVSVRFPEEISFVRMLRLVLESLAILLLLTIIWRRFRS